MPSQHDERAEARERLKASVDALTERANLQVQLQKEPIKMLGGASAVGALLGVVVGRQFKRSKKIYVDVESPIKHQKALMKAQKHHKGGGNVGGALVATLGTLAFKVLNDRVLTPKLEEMASGLLERAGQEPAAKSAPMKSAPKSTQPGALQQPAASLASSSQAGAAPASSGGVVSFLKRDQTPETGGNAQSGLPGSQTAPAAGSPTTGSPTTGSSVPAPKGTTPKGTVEAKAQGSPIGAQEKANPNIR